MKLNHVILLSALMLSASGYSQTGGGTTGGTGTAGTGTSGPGTPNVPGPGTRITPQPLLPRGQSPGQQPANPNLSQQGQALPGQNPQPIGTNAGLTPLVDTNQFVLWNTNQLGLATNGLGVGTNLTPTSQVGFTNRILSSNTAGVMTNTSPMLMRDQALSETDRRLLAQIRGAVFGANAATAPSAAAPIHFILKDGVVRLVGTVSTMEERQRIENLVQQVPGVVRVFDALQVSQSGAQPTAQ
jgi:hypothetical protein